MDTPPKKRRFWQLHLSTAVLLMFGAGGIVWLNLPLSFTADSLTPKNAPQYGLVTDYQTGWIERGWPFAFYRTKAFFASYALGSTTGAIRHLYEGQESLLVMDDGIAVPAGKQEPIFIILDGLLDGVVGLALLFVLAAVCESLLRRREGRKP